MNRLLFTAPLSKRLGRVTYAFVLAFAVLCSPPARGHHNEPRGSAVTEEAVHTTIARLDAALQTAAVQAGVTDFHFAALFQPHIRSEAAASFRAFLANVLCANSAESNRHPLSGRRESHAAQGLNAAIYAFGHATEIGGECGTLTVSDLVRRERARPEYTAAVSFIETSLSSMLRRSPTSAHDQESWMRSPERQTLRRHLTDLDLSWFVQIAAMDDSSRSIPFKTASANGRDGASSLAAMIEAQLEYVRLSEQAPDVNYLTEYGAHTAGMLTLVHAAFHGDPSVRPHSDAFRAHIEILLARLSDAIKSARRHRPLDAQRLSGHLLQIMSCAPSDTRLPTAHPSPAAVATELLEGAGNTDLGVSVSAWAHSYMALRVYEKVLRGAAISLRDCVLV